MSLAPYAVSELNSRGRQYPTPLARDRTAFQRDVSRLIHSEAFRRLQGKSQVFSPCEGDLQRTRLSHSLEVSQIATTVCRQLHLNDDLANALALGHDIGHAPFGHLGQDVLNATLSQDGGFEHNWQALRLVDTLISPYPEHPGLNLMFETREGLLKHCTPARAQQLGEVAARHKDGSQPTLESQVVDWSDALAYVHADIEDGLRHGLLTLEQVVEIPGYKACWQAKVAPRLNQKTHPTTVSISASTTLAREARVTVQTVLREMMTEAVDDLFKTSQLAIRHAHVRSLEDVRQAEHELVGPSPEALQHHRALKAWSRTHLYGHPRLQASRSLCDHILRDVVQAYLTDPKEMSGLGAPSTLPVALSRQIADHVAGMTDRYVLREHARLYGPSWTHTLNEVWHKTTGQPRFKSQHSVPPLSVLLPAPPQPLSTPQQASTSQRRMRA